MFRSIVRENKERFSKELLLNQERVLTMIDGSESFIIKGTIENICNFIMFVNSLAKREGESVDLQFSLDTNTGWYDDLFMNTIGHYIDLCSNTEYLEEVKKFLIPLQLDFEEKLYSGENLPSYSFIYFENEEEKVYTN